MSHSKFVPQVGSGTGEPIYRQLVDQVARAIAAGTLQAGDAMPSVRELAVLLAVHPMTISKAYSLLESSGKLVRRRGLAMVVADGHSRALPVEQRVELLRPTLRKTVTESVQLGLSAEDAAHAFKDVFAEHLTALGGANHPA